MTLPDARFDLSEWTSRIQARSGASVCVRPLRSDDREREIAFMSSLSERSRYLELSLNVNGELVVDPCHARRGPCSALRFIALVP